MAVIVHIQMTANGVIRNG